MAAKLAKEEPRLLLAKFDATENDVPEKYKVEGFPTIYFAPSGAKDNPIKYSGNRDLEDLEKFMRKHAVAAFVGKKKKEEEVGRDELWFWAAEEGELSGKMWSKI